MPSLSVARPWPRVARFVGVALLAVLATAPWPTPAQPPPPDFRLPDLIVSAVDTAAMEVDCADATVSGTVSAIVSNIGLAPCGTTHVAAFIDVDRDGALGPPDQLLGEAEVPAFAGPVEPDYALVHQAIAIALVGNLPFVGAPIHVAADSKDEIEEANEGRDNAATSIGVQPPPPPTPDFAIMQKYHALSDRYILASPIVANLTDDNGDDRIDERDIPDIAVPASVGFDRDEGACVTVVSGADGHVIYEDCEHLVRAGTDFVVGDIDMDGRPELVAAAHPEQSLRAFDFDPEGWHFKWTSQSVAPLTLPGGGSSQPQLKVNPILADLDGDGTVEIIMGPVVFMSQGEAPAEGVLVDDFRTPAPPGGAPVGRNDWSGHVAVADVDLDGGLELVVGPSILHFAGGALYRDHHNTSLAATDGFVAVANLDADPFAEIVLVGNNHVYVLDHEMHVETTVNLGNSNRGSVATVADLDGVFPPEVVVGRNNRVRALRPDGATFWTPSEIVIADDSQRVGMAAFDLDGDGLPELIHRDEHLVRIIKHDGTQPPGGHMPLPDIDVNVVASMEDDYYFASTGAESPTIADVDGDGHAEIIVTFDEYEATPAQRLQHGDRATGIRVFGHAGAGWAAARPIWNQAAYSVTNVNDDGSIPRQPTLNWRDPRVQPGNHFHQQVGPHGLTYVYPDLTASVITSDPAGCPGTAVIRVRVGNGGTHVAPIADVTFRLGDPLTGDHLDTVRTTRPLYPGEFETLELILDAPFSSEPICVTADLDAEGESAIEEADETNNSCCSAFTDPCAPPPPPVLPVLPVEDASTDHSDAVLLEATLQDETVAPPVPVAGVFVTFELEQSGPVCRALTDAEGHASCHVTPLTPADDTVEFTATSDATSRYESASGIGNLVVTHEQAVLVDRSVLVQPWNGGVLEARALLLQDGALALAAGQSVSFAVGAASEPGTTDGDGVASATFEGLAPGDHEVSASFDETPTHAATSVAPVTVHLLAPQLRITPVAVAVDGGTQHDVTAEILDDGSDLEDRRVIFEIVQGPGSGHLNSGGEAQTQAGIATWAYTTGGNGYDVIEAFLDDNENGIRDGGEPLATATVGVVTPMPTTAKLTGALEGNVFDPVQLSGSLVVTDGLVPISGATLEFQLGSLRCLAVTDQDGQAACDVTPVTDSGSDPSLSVSYAGDEVRAPSADQATFDVTPEQSTVTMMYAYQVRTPTGKDVVMQARLRQDGAEPIQGRTVTFHIGARTQDGVADATGLATASLVALGAPAEPVGTPVYATFAGDDWYASSQSSSIPLCEEEGACPPEVSTYAAIGPPPPDNVAATWIGDGAVKVTWTHPYFPLPWSITGYTVTAEPGGRTASAPASDTERVITGLDNGTAYTFTVASSNQYWTSGASSPVAGPVTPLRVPDAPAGLALSTASATSLDVSWSALGAPGNGGEAPQTYEVILFPRSDLNDSYPVAYPATGTTISGLVTGMPYTARIRALNTVGDGIYSAASASASPKAAPSEPEPVRVAVDGTTATVYWHEPSDLGGTAIGGYAITVDQGATCSNDAVDGNTVTTQCTGLPVGVPLTFSVVADNGQESDPAESLPVTLASPPDAPELLAVRDNAAVHLTWTLGTGDGGSPVLGVRHDDGTVPVTASSNLGETERIVTGLTNGEDCTFEARAVNAIGESPATPATVTAPTLRPARQPERVRDHQDFAGEPDFESGAPYAVHGNGMATVHWRAPDFDGGEKVLDYTITCVPACLPVVVPAGDPPEAEFTAVVGNLANGFERRLLVTARNEVGPGAISLESNPVTPARCPDAVPFVTPVVDGDRAIRVTWARPLFDGGSRLTGYTVTRLIDGIPDGTPVPLAPSATNWRFTDLTACASYTFEVLAENAESAGSPLGACLPRVSAAVVAVTKPDVPTSPLAVAGNATATVTWAPPVPIPGLGDGCSEIETYTVRPIPGDVDPITIPASTNPLEVTFQQLANGQPYTFEVTATNAIGAGPAAVAGPVTPCGPPYRPSAVMASVSGDAKIRVTWPPPPWDGGCPVLLPYALEADPAATSMAWLSDLEVEFTVPQVGIPYTFSVTAHNSAGDSLPAVSEALVAATCPDPPPHTTPPTPPDLPTAPYIMVLPGDEMLRACWQAPEFDGHSEITGYVVGVTPPRVPDEDIEVDAGTTCAIITGLTNTTQAYTVHVRAVNAACEGDWSAESDPVTPRPLEVDLLVVHAPVPDPQTNPPTPWLTGGLNTTGTVLLNGIAPPGGVTVEVVTDPTDGAAWPHPLPEDWPDPMLVTVPAGQAHATFAVRTAAVDTVEDVLFTATLAGTLSSESQVLHVHPIPSNQAPLVRIDSPADGAVVTDYDTFVHVTVQAAELPGGGPDLDHWILEARSVEGGPWEELDSSGTEEEQDDAEVARFDPTLRLNGQYELRLQAWNVGLTEVAEASAFITVEGYQKIGHFTLAYVDLTVAAAEFPVQITRTYDSRDQRMGDFGHGWRLSLSDVRLERNIPIGDRWDEVNHTGPSFLDWPQFCMEPLRPHVVTVTFPTGKVYRFNAIFETQIGSGNPCSIAGASYGWVRFVPEGATRGTLKAVDGDGDAVARTPLYFVTGAPGHLALEVDDDEAFDPAQYELTTEDGLEYRLSLAPVDVGGAVVGGHLLWVENRNGGRITIDANGVHSTEADGDIVTIVRDGSGRVQEINHPVIDDEGMVVQQAGERMTYVYDQGRLIEYFDSVQQALEDDTEPQTVGVPVTFAYDDPIHPHYLTSVVDQVGHRPVKNLYADDGRLEFICDGFGYDSVSAPDAPGNCIDVSVFDSDLSGHNRTVRDRKGNATFLQYDSRGLVTFRRDATLQPWHYTYGDDDQVETETNPLGDVTTYGFDTSGNVNAITNGEDEVTHHRWGPGQTLLATWFNEEDEADGWRSGYDSRGNLLTETDPLGKQTSHVREELGVASGVLFTTIDATGAITTSETRFGRPYRDEDAEGVVTKPVTDSRGNLKRLRTYRDGVPVDGSGIKNVYDASGRLLKSYQAYDNGTDPIVWDDVPFTETAYDAAGRRIIERDELERETLYAYNELGQLVSITYPGEDPPGPDRMETFEYDLNGNRTKVTDREGRITQHCHDALDRVVLTWWSDESITCEPSTPLADLPDSPHVMQEYDAAGRLFRRTDERGNATTYEYDEAGRQTEVTVDADEDPVEQDLQTTTTSYNAKGWVQWVQDPKEHYTTYGYDLAGRKTYECRGEADTAHPDDTDAHCTTYGYDDVGRVISETDATGKTTTFGHDDNGRLVRVTDALDHTTRYEFDDLGNMSAQVDALQRRTTYEHDLQGRRTARVLPLGQPPATGYREEFGYTVTGFMDAKVTFRGQSITHVPEESTDRVESTTYSDEPTPDYTFGYTPGGSRQTADDVLRGLTTWTHADPPGRGWLTGISQPDVPALEYGHDAAGNVTSITVVEGNPPGPVVTQEFDGLNRLEAVIDAALGTTSVEYDDAGNLESVTYPNGLVAEYDHDVMNRLDSLTWTQGEGGPLVAHFDYDVDLAGHRTALHETWASDEFGVTARSTHWEHDDVHRLIEERIEEPSVGVVSRIEWDYDPVGNRTEERRYVGASTVPEQVTNWTHDDNDRILTAGPLTYAWNADGTLASVAGGPDGIVAYEWDALERMTEATIGLESVEFEYDADGIRVSRTQGSETVHYLVDANRPYAQVLEERDALGQVLTRYLHGLRPLAQAATAGPSRWYLHDGLGSTRAVAVAGTGAIAGRMAYEAFGTMRDEAGEAGADYLFAGEQLDEALALYYLRARWMSPNQGRLVSRDPWQGTLRQVYSRHAYAYGANLPTEYGDPSGRSAVLLEQVGQLTRGQLMVMAVATVAVGGIVAAQGVDFQIDAVRFEQALDRLVESIRILPPQFEMARPNKDMIKGAEGQLKNIAKHRIKLQNPNQNGGPGWIPKWLRDIKKALVEMRKRYQNLRNEAQFERLEALRRAAIEEFRPLAQKYGIPWEF